MNFAGKKQIITEKGIKILFGGIENYIDQFMWIHKECNETKFIDVENKENIDNFIKDIENIYGKSIEELINDRKLIKKIVKESREKTDVTISRLAEILNLPQSTIGRYSKK